jgi:4-alpha-glucanotransferase
MSDKPSRQRTSGILLHISSLASVFGIGDIGPAAYQFVDFLSAAKQSLWQVLPLNPTDGIYGHSPYSSISAFAANTLLISPQLLAGDGFLRREDIEPIPDFSKERVDYAAVAAYKANLFDKAFGNFKSRADKKAFKQFCALNINWLDDFAFFVALKDYYKGIAWCNWPSGVRDRNPKYLSALKKELWERIERERFLQYVFFKQWQALKEYCKQKHIELIGDIPIYVSYDSADVWANPEYFKLDKEKKLISVAGVPPDYFSKTGQRWGNPIYRWDALKKKQFSWWIERIAHNLKLFDSIRIDHFLGFVNYWEIPVGEETAVGGKWVKAPAVDFFKVLLRHLPHLPLIAEDLGLINNEVRKLMRQFGFPGMKVLMFAFGEDLPTHPYLPHNYIENCLVYTGTHDNNTVRGWFDHEASQEAKKRLFSYLGHEPLAEQIHWEFIRLAMMSVAKTIIIPMQDVLGLGANARMNIPSTTLGNWQWRLLGHQLSDAIAGMLAQMATLYAREPAKK